jgi:hypothetical protein
MNTAKNTTFFTEKSAVKVKVRGMITLAAKPKDHGSKRKTYLGVFESFHGKDHSLSKNIVRLEIGLSYDHVF